MHPIIYFTFSNFREIDILNLLDFAFFQVKTWNLFVRTLYCDVAPLAYFFIGEESNSKVQYTCADEGVNASATLWLTG